MQTRVAMLLAQARADLAFAFVDAMLISLAYIAALGIRSLDGEVPAVWWGRVLVALPVIVVVHLISNVAAGAYGHVWEYASVSEAKRVIVASFWAGTVLTLGTLAFADRPIPLSVVVLGSGLTIGFLGVVRFRSRLFSFHRTLKLDSRERVLILGTGKRAADLARNTLRGPYGVTVVGFVSPGPTMGVRRLAGLPILGELEQIADLIFRYEIHQVIVAAEGGSALSRRLVDLCVDVDVRLRIVPDLDDILNGFDGGPDIRDLELEDLLLRPAVTTDLNSVSAILSGKTVLVTGAGGSIGSEIVTQALRFMPKRLIAMDHDETHLHDGMLSWDPPAGTKLTPVLCDLRDEEKLSQIIAKYRPHVVYHAAAHKHVPILERWPEEAVKTNIAGTENLLAAIRDTRVERFVLISTDKTVSPTSVMGASKRIAELLVQAESQTNPDGCSYSSVRFGNVLGSRGSVVPTFMEQIRRGGPVTITDERMTRYFMTVGEAVELVLQASALAENGEVFVLDMGTPVKIIDLAHRMIRLGGLVPGRDIEVKISGARPGEKLYEELTHGPLMASPHPQINIADSPIPSTLVLREFLGRLGGLTDSPKSGAELKGLLLGFANQYEWTSTETIDLTDESVDLREGTIEMTGEELSLHEMREG